MTELSPRIERRLGEAAGELDLTRAFRPRGVVRRVGDGVALVDGLSGVGSEELLAFDSGSFGLAYDLAIDSTGVILLSGGERVTAGEGVEGLGELPSIPVGVEALGRILDPMGHPLDDGPPLPTRDRRPLFRLAAEFIDRKSVDEPLHTGVMVLDAAIPIGRGQRELVVGDRNVGKTALALDVVAAQRRGDVACVYVVIGQPMSRVLALRDDLYREGAMENTAIVAADASMAPGMQYLAPYAGAAVAEWFREQGGHALVVYDDLTKHADAYRELALLLDRPPGREAFPGDIFYVHAQLLERANAWKQDNGGGSVTALPIVETTDSDISAYIPTNLISITDGQIYLDTARYERNERPAVDVGRSVSRIGAVAQPDALRAAARNLRILVSRFEAVESLTRVGLDVDPATARTIRRGRILRELLRQGRFRDRSVAEQVLTLTAVAQGWLDELEPKAARAAIQRSIDRARAALEPTMRKLDSGELPPEGWEESFHAVVETTPEKESS